MFTGLIQSTGKILHIHAASGGEARFAVQSVRTLGGYTVGESIAVNGACLTVEHFNADNFSAYASAETLSRTNLGTLRRGDTVNLEKAMRMGDSLGGHMVSGHIDGQCEVLAIRSVGSSKIIRFSIPAGYARQIIPKGSVAVDGVSLTVNDCGPDFFEVNVIPGTQDETTIGAWKAGRMINLETDLIGKYVERMVGYYSGAIRAEYSAATEKAQGLTLDILRDNGF